MNDTVVTIIAIFLAAILMFIFPLMTLADRNDDISQLSIQTATDELVLQMTKTGKITEDEYNSFVKSQQEKNVTIVANNTKITAADF